MVYLFFGKNFQSLGSILRLKHFIAITYKINLNQIRNLFSSSTTKIFISGMMSPPHMLTYMTYSNIIYQGFPYFFLEILWEFLLQCTGPPYNGNIFFHLYTLNKID